MVLKESRDTGWELLRTKKVEDSDGFETDYTLYYNSFDSMYSCIFGDNEVYNPDNTEPDWEGESREEADEWFDTYTGFGEFEDEDFIDDFDDDFDEFDTDLDDDEFDDELYNPYEESCKVSERLDGTINISGERTYDGVHYYVLSADFSVDDISVVNSISSQLGFPVQQMGYSDRLWVRADKSELQDLRTAVDTFNSTSLKESRYAEFDEFDDDFEESVTRTARKSTTLEDIGYEQCYIDTDGIMGEPNKIWSTSELYNAWCEDSEYDPSMLEFDTYEDWLAYTLADMSPVEDDTKLTLRTDPNEERYVDVDGVMGDVGQTWSVSELRNYWEEEKDYDPTLADYTSFDYWLEDTLGLMEPVM